MSNGVRVEVEGADRLASTMHAAANKIDNLDKALDDAGRLVEQRARSGAPVRTGALARSIRADRSGDEVTIATGVGVYAGVQEYGSATTPAHPYMRPALDLSEPVIVGYFERDLADALNHVKGA